VERPPSVWQDQSGLPFPLVTGAGEILWWDELGLFTEDGTRLVSLGVKDAVVDEVAGDTQSGLLVRWSSGYSSYVSLFTGGSEVRTGRYGSGVVHSMATLAREQAALYGSMPDDQAGVPLATTYVYGGVVPALIDLEGGIAHAYASPFLDAGFPFTNGRAIARAVQHGPFARVIGTGSCLNVRAEPSESAGVLTCAADGVLLQDLGQAAEADGRTWAMVMTPAGEQGWAAAEYLER
jgi:hypothetical protein